MAGEEEKVVGDLRRLLFKVMSYDLRVAQQGIITHRNVFEEAYLDVNGQEVNAKEIEVCLQEYIHKVFPKGKNEDLLGYLMEKHRVYIERNFEEDVRSGFGREDFERVRKYRKREGGEPGLSHRFEEVRRLFADPDFNLSEVVVKGEGEVEEVRSYAEYPGEGRLQGVGLPEDSVFRTAWKKLSKSVFKVYKPFQRHKF